MTGESTLDLEPVKKRFIESEEALRSIREELEAILAQRRRADAATATLEESGQAIESFAAKVSTLVEHVANLTKQIKDAVERLDALLSGTDIERLRADIASQVENLRGELQREVADLGRRIDEKSESAGVHMERIFEALPKRWRRRAERR
jgi:predicted  nucleic acid-binding Zn-ribbon protein